MLHALSVDNEGTLSFKQSQPVSGIVKKHNPALHSVSCNEFSSAVLCASNDGLWVVDGESMEITNACSFKKQSSVTSAKFSAYNTVITSDILGRLRTWDTRTLDRNLQYVASSSMTSSIQASSMELMITAIASHPRRPHLIAVGLEEGSICLWDARKSEQKLWQGQFHDRCAVNSLSFDGGSEHVSFFSAASDGLLVKWMPSLEPNSWIPFVMLQRNAALSCVGYNFDHSLCAVGDETSSVIVRSLSKA